MSPVTMAERRGPQLPRNLPEMGRLAPTGGSSVRFFASDPAWRTGPLLAEVKPLSSVAQIRSTRQ